MCVGSSLSIIITVMIYLLELIQRRRSTRSVWRLNSVVIRRRNIHSCRHWRRRSYKRWYVLLQRDGSDDDGDTHHQVERWTRGLHPEVQPVLDINDAAVS